MQMLSICLFIFVTTISINALPNLCSNGTSLTSTCFINESKTFTSPGIFIAGCGDIVVGPGVILDCVVPPPLFAILQDLLGILKSPLPRCEIRISTKGNITVHGTIRATTVSLIGSDVHITSTGLVDTTARGYGATKVDLDLGGGSLASIPLWTGSAPGTPNIDLSGLGNTLTLNNILSIVGALACSGGSGGGNKGAGGTGSCCLILNLCLNPPNPGGHGSRDPIRGDFLFDSGSVGGYGGSASQLLLNLCIKATILGAGGAGGGQIQITAKNKLFLDGALRSQGESLTSGSNSVSGGGGGAGGSIAIDTDSIVGAGTIDASGGAGGNPGGGGGGGGYVVLYTANGTIPASVHVYVYGGAAGSCGSSGDPGKFTVFKGRLNQDVSLLSSLDVDFVSYRFPTKSNPDLSIVVKPESVNLPGFGSTLIENYDLLENESYSVNETLDYAIETVNFANFEFSFDRIVEISLVNQQTNSSANISNGHPIGDLLTTLLSIADLSLLQSVEATVSNVVKLSFDIFNSLRSKNILTYHSFNSEKQNCKISFELDPFSFSSPDNYLRYRFYIYSKHNISSYNFTVNDVTNEMVVTLVNGYNWKLLSNFSISMVSVNQSTDLDQLLFYPEPCLLSDLALLESQGNCFSKFPVDEWKNVIVVSMLVPYYNESVFIDPNFQILFGGSKGSGGDGGTDETPLDDDYGDGDGAGDGDGTGTEESSLGGSNAKYIAIGVCIGAFVVLVIVVATIVIVAYILAHKKARRTRQGAQAIVF